MGRYQVETEDGVFEIETDEPSVEAPLAAAQTSPGRVFTGGLTNILGGLTFGAADELLAGGNAAMDYLGGQSYGDAYNQRLNDVRSMQQEFRQSAGGPESAFVDIGSSILTPIGKIGQALRITRAASPAITLSERVKDAAKLGAATGGAVGALGSEGGLENRAIGAGIGATAGAALGGGLEYGATKGQQVFDSASDAFRSSALGLRVSDIKNSRKFSKAVRSEASPLGKAIDSLDERGLFKGNKAPEEILARNEDMLTKEANSISTILKEADATREAAKDLVVPDMKNAQAFLAKAPPGSVDSLSTQYERVMKDIYSKWDGSIQGLQSLKKDMYRISYKNSTDSADLNKAIAEDLKDAVVSGVNKFSGKTAAAKVVATNKKMADNLTLRPILERVRDQEEQGVGGAAQMVKRLLVTPLGGAAAGAVYGASTGDWETAAKYGVGGALLASRGGQWAMSNLSRKAANALGPTAGNKLMQAFVPFLGEKNQNIASTNLPQEQTPQAQQYQQPAQPISLPELISSQPPIIQAIIGVESAKNPRAVSKAGALGLMQLMPANAKKLGIDPLDPEQNIQGGMAILSEEMDRYKDPVLALAAYNAGSSKVNAAIKKAGSRDWNKVKRFLKAETRAYPAKVMAMLGKIDSGVY